MAKFTEEEYKILKQRSENNRKALDKPAPKRKRGQRKGTHVTRDQLPPDDSGKCTETACPLCGCTYRTATRIGKTHKGNLEFDVFTCNCKPKGHKYERYK